MAGPRANAAAKARASARRHSKQGRCPAASAVGSSSEQLGVAPTPNVSMPSLEVEAATNPSARDPASSAEGLPVAMEAAAAIAEQQAARSIGKQIAERIDAVGQRHWDSSPLGVTDLVRRTWRRRRPIF